MDNDLYRIMIFNAKQKIEKQNPAQPKQGDLNAFQIAEMMSMLIGKDSGKILMDIIK
jgi:hypothetical protein